MKRLDLSWPLSLLGTAIVFSFSMVLAAGILQEPAQVCRTFPPDRWVRVTDAETGKTALVNMAAQAIILSAEITEKSGKKRPVSKIFSGQMSPGESGPVYGFITATETPEQLVRP